MPVFLAHSQFLSFIINRLPYQYLFSIFFLMLVLRILKISKNYSMLLCYFGPLYFGVILQISHLKLSVLDRFIQPVKDLIHLINWFRPFWLIKKICLPIRNEYYASYFYYVKKTTPCAWQHVKTGISFSFLPQESLLLGAIAFCDIVPEPALWSSHLRQHIWSISLKGENFI